MVPRRELASFLISLCGFFVGRAVVFTFISPLTLPFLAVYMGVGRGFMLTALFLGLGVATRLSDIFMARYDRAALHLLLFRETGRNIYTPPVF
jgi:hypothetical protein